MVFWDNQRITLRGSPLRTGLHGNIAFGETKQTPKITTIRHLNQTTTIDRVTTQNLKTRAEIENETGKTLTQIEYQNIKTATTSILRVYGFTWDNIPIENNGPNHRGY